jgi:hypothetical protein
MRIRLEPMWRLAITGRSHCATEKAVIGEQEQDQPSKVVTGDR